MSASKKEEQGDAAADARLPAAHGQQADAQVASGQQAHGAVPEQKPRLSRHERIERWFQVATAVLLGVVAVATAWSSYQAARWNGTQSTLYAQASTLRAQASRATTLGGQLRIYDVNLFDEWLNAYSRGETKLADIYQRRFRAEYLPAFNAWLATNPFTSSNAPPGPTFMPQYKISLEQQGAQLEAAATRTFAQGQDANQHSDDYVLNTVFLAVVLLLVAIAERFEWHALRAVVLAFALLLLLFGLYHLVTYPIT